MTTPARAALTDLRADYVYDGEIVPYVRMTQRGKFVKPNARRYLASKDALAWSLLEQREKWGGAMIGKAPFRVAFTFARPDVYRIDIDNLVKAALDSAQGVLFVDDRWCVEIRASKRRGEHWMAMRLEEVESE